MRVGSRWLPDQLADMYWRHEKGETYKSIAENFGISATRVAQLVNREWWRRIETTDTASGPFCLLDNKWIWTDAETDKRKLPTGPASYDSIWTG